MSEFDGGSGGLLAEINAEHAVLTNRIVKLERVCEGLDERTSCKDCPPEKTSGCADALIQEIGDLLAYMVEHFRHEERGMQGSGYAIREGAKYSAHVEDHANISEYFTGIVGEFNDADPCPQAVKLRDLLEMWINTHISEFDAALLANLAGDDHPRDAITENTA